jgi:hypothetical protein
LKREGETETETETETERERETVTETERETNKRWFSIGKRENEGKRGRCQTKQVDPGTGEEASTGVFMSYSRERG